MVSMIWLAWLTMDDPLPRKAQVQRERTCVSAEIAMRSQGCVFKARQQRAMFAGNPALLDKAAVVGASTQFRRIAPSPSINSSRPVDG